jgi:hypothetical protein
MNMYGVVYVYIPLFLISAVVRSERSSSRPGRFIPGEIDPGPHWIESWVGSSTCLGDTGVKLFYFTEIRTLAPRSFSP